MRSYLVILLLSLFLMNRSYGDDFTTNAKVDFWGAAQDRFLRTTEFNPDNKVAKLPSKVYEFELRPDLRFSNEDTTLRFRPRLMSSWEKAEINGEKKPWQPERKLQWSEAYMSRALGDLVQVVYGLQNFQWGPAEVTSPSNRIFRDTVQVKDLLYDGRGKHLLRFNYTYLKNLSEVLIVEVSDNGEGAYTDQQLYGRKALLKSEYTWDDTSHYLGFVIGAREFDRPWLGEYGHYELLDSLSVYFDASHQKGSLAFYPERAEKTGVVSLQQNHQFSNRIYTFAVGGMRYAFENGDDARFEWVFQEAGYSQKDANDFWNANRSSNLAQQIFLEENARRFNRKGLEFTKQQLGLASLRVPDFMGLKDSQFYIRCLFSPLDGSAQSYLSEELAIRETGTLFFGGSLASGRDDSELAGFVEKTAFFGYRHSW